MFEDYVATKKDLETIEEGLRFVERGELGFIFENRPLIEKVAVVSQPILSPPPLASIGVGGR